MQRVVHFLICENTLPGHQGKKAFLGRLCLTLPKAKNQAITAERNWLISKQYQGQWSPAERARLKDIAKRYKVKWSGNTRRIPWNSLLERVDIIPSNVWWATMAAAEGSGWGTSKLARNNNNLFGMKCGGGNLSPCDEYSPVG